MWIHTGSRRKNFPSETSLSLALINPRSEAVWPLTQSSFFYWQYICQFIRGYVDKAFLYTDEPNRRREGLNQFCQFSIAEFFQLMAVMCLWTKFVNKNPFASLVAYITSIKNQMLSIVSQSAANTKLIQYHIGQFCFYFHFVFRTKALSINFILTLFF